MDQALYERFAHGAERRGSHCAKWDDCAAVFGKPDVLPLWVADMDFEAPQPVIDALQRRVEHGVFGYQMELSETARATTDWMRARHGLDLRDEAALLSPGVVDSLLFCLRAFTEPGDLVAAQTPVYGPFYRVIERAGCRVYANPLVESAQGWQMDFEQLERGFRAGVRALLLCSPHNPVGRVWTRAELERLVALCARYGVKIISDEIHSDLIMPGFRHTPILALDPGAVQLISATKSFNLAGLRCSSVLASDARVREAVRAQMEAFGVGGVNLLGLLAQDTAYRECAPWLDALIEYLAANRDYACAFIRDKLAPLKAEPMQGTYLLWLDARGLGLAQDALSRFFVERAGVGLNSGTDFGAEGAGFMRINLAAPRATLRRAFLQIEEAMRSL